MPQGKKSTRDLDIEKLVPSLRIAYSQRWISTKQAKALSELPLEEQIAISDSMSDKWIQRANIKDFIYERSGLILLTLILLGVIFLWIYLK